MRKQNYITIALVFSVFLVSLLISGAGCQQQTTDKEQTCINSGGNVTTITCYCSGSGPDFFNTCPEGPIGACTCGADPQYAHQVKTCECGENRCFDGNKCTEMSLNSS